MSPEHVHAKAEEKAEQLKFDLGQAMDANSNHSKTTDTDRKIKPKSFSEQPQSENNEKKKKPTKKELRQEKKYFRQLWKLEGKGGVHDTMQKLPPNRPDVHIPRQIYPDQERKDWRKLHPKENINGFRLNTNPDIILTREQFSAYTKLIMSLTEEERINLALTNAEIYDRRRRAWKYRKY